MVKDKVFSFKDLVLKEQPKEAFERSVLDLLVVLVVLNKGLGIEVKGLKNI